MPWLITVEMDETACLQRLPVEIWLSIFQQLHPFQLARSAHTSRTWQRLTLERTLWTDFSLPYIQLHALPYLIALSRPAPLSLELWPGDQTTIASLTAYHILRNNMGRMKRLVLRGVSPAKHDWCDAMSALLQTPAPILERLSIDTRGARTMLEVPTTLFGGDAPLLHEVDLERCGVNLATPVLTHVRSLKLNAGCILAPYAIDLLASDMLRYLEFWVDPSFTPPSLPLVVHLPNLREVAIRVRGLHPLKKGQDGPCWIDIQTALQEKGFMSSETTVAGGLSSVSVYLLNAQQAVDIASQAGAAVSCALTDVAGILHIGLQCS